MAPRDSPPLIYPMVLCVAIYLLHTIQNFRFIYSLPSLDFFLIALWITCVSKPLWMYVGIFLVATLNRETTLLLLPIYAISEMVTSRGTIDWRRLRSSTVPSAILPLLLYWLIWQVAVRHLFAHNPSEFYPRGFPRISAFFYRHTLGLRCWASAATSFPSSSSFENISAMRSGGHGSACFLCGLPSCSSMAFSSRPAFSAN